MPTTDDILDKIDFEPITAAIRAEPLVNWGYEDAAKIVWNVATRFLPGDLERYQRVAGIEQHWVLETGAGRSSLVHFGAGADKVINLYGERSFGDNSPTIHGYADLVMQLADGSTEVIDWKTAGDLDKAWRDRLTDSWQWKLYCAVYDARAFAYRGIEKSSLEPKIPGVQYDWSKAPMKEMRYEPSVTNRQDVLRHLATTFAMRDTLEVHFPLTAWPRRMPDGCRSFGQRCTYWDVCRGGAPMPEGLYKSKAFSYSGMGKFLNCPEHYRLDTATGVRTSSTATDLGNAVHRGTAALYEQFNYLKGELYGRREEEAAALPGADSSAHGGSAAGEADRA